MKRALLLVAVLALVASCGRDHPSTRAGEPWARVSATPLPAHSDAILAWTGDEVLAFGRTDLQHCTDGCGNDVVFAEAYNPADDTWRSIAPAPASFFRNRSYAFAGGRLFSHEYDDPEHLQQYDLATDEWITLTTPDLSQDRLVGAEDHLLAIRQCGCPDLDPPDLELDIVTGEWRELPDAPVDNTVSRQIVPIDGRYYLFANDPTVERASAAVLHPDDGAWGELGSTDGTVFQPLNVVDGLVVSTLQPFSIDTDDTYPPQVWAFDTATDEFVDVPALTEPMEARVDTVAGEDTLWFGDMALDRTTLTWSESARPPDFGYMRSWIGDRYVAFGGEDDVSDTYTWSP